MQGKPTGIMLVGCMWLVVACLLQINATNFAVSTSKSKLRYVGCGSPSNFLNESVWSGRYMSVDCSFVDPRGHPSRVQAVECKNNLNDSRSVL